MQLIQAVLVAKRGIQLTAGRSNRLTGGKCGLACQRPYEIRMQAKEAVGHGRGTELDGEEHVLQIHDRSKIKA